jgi:hypothetical protein
VLELHDRLGAAHGKRPEGVAQIVKTDRTKTGTPARVEEPPAQGRAVLIAADLADEDQIVITDELGAMAQTGERLSDLRHHRHRPAVTRLRCRQLAVGIAAGHSHG